MSWKARSAGRPCHAPLATSAIPRSLSTHTRNGCCSPRSPFVEGPVSRPPLRARACVCVGAPESLGESARLCSDLTRRGRAHGGNEYRWD
mgnify:CR=1 FL=1|jgi:hypothetical protein